MVGLFNTHFSFFALSSSIDSHSRLDVKFKKITLYKTLNFF
jgi:hypothetical protein